MSLGARLKNKRLQKNFTQEEVADAIGTTKQTIYKYENNIITNIPLDKIEQLAKLFEVSPLYLTGWEKKKEEAAPSILTDWYDPLIDAYQEAADPTQENVCKLLDIDHVKPGVAPEPKQESLVCDAFDIPTSIDKVVYDYPAAAGQPLYATDEFERIDFPIDSVPIDADFGVRISGRSMEPGIMDGDIVWVYETQTLTDGEVGVFMIDEDEAVCKRVKLKPHGKIDRLASDNEDEPDIYPKDIDFEIKVVGKVVGTFTE